MGGDSEGILRFSHWEITGALTLHPQMSWRLFPRLHPNAIPEFILVIIIRFVLVIIIIVHKNVIPILVFEAIGRSQMHWLCIDFALSMPPQVSWCPHRDLHIYKVLFPKFQSIQMTQHSIIFCNLSSNPHQAFIAICSNSHQAYLAICLQVHIKLSLQFVLCNLSSNPHQARYNLTQHNHQRVDME